MHLRQIFATRKLELNEVHFKMEHLLMGNTAGAICNNTTNNITSMSTAYGTKTHLSGAIILLKYVFVKMGHNSKTIALRVMPLVL